MFNIWAIFSNHDLNLQSKNPSNFLNYLIEYIFRSVRVFSYHLLKIYLLNAKFIYFSMQVGVKQKNSFSIF